MVVSAFELLQIVFSLLTSITQIMEGRVILAATLLPPRNDGVMHPKRLFNGIQLTLNSYGNLSLGYQSCVSLKTRPCHFHCAGEWF